MKTLLVTGGAGFIGANFVYYWLNTYPEDRLIVLDALTYAGNRASLAQAEKNPNVEFIHADIRDQDRVETLLVREKISTIVHFAAESHVDRSIIGPDAFIDTNIIGTHSLLKAAKNNWLDQHPQPHRFHHISTDEVYGTLKPSDPPFSEETPYAPNSPYAASKASSDHLVRAYHETYGLEVTTSNCSNNYGPYQFPEKLIPLMIVNILHDIPIPVYGDGLQIRDWLYVDDHNLGVDLILKKGIPGQTYNIGGNNEKRNIDIVRLVCSLMDKKLDRKTPADTLITHVTDRAGHDRRYAINAKKITQDLGYVPRTTFEQGIEKTIDWYLDNKTWWKPLVK
ncbi:MAG: dTDP-glucose 4,6-dehydratase [Proteobacteria bacterium]|nr:dTDP-glucose 4,6-dehydratase [Pseudomonadota bacterium]MBU1388673.1 dTDP-glucose 4,6-dehydratase [Pseudomonadota bacterium]MBU1544858.1 dTDP-glucose 4,6-dehydratase [Pseudomonadota bacterium]MBU2430930.1 dTDP-glucose 4,6-dehydratase [Pseudomonadota bacterium]MBU2480223.1 dTDP-glucose 4,6-dehydratase [Pseudomonadota bacterium]